MSNRGRHYGKKWPDADAYCANNGRNILVWSYGHYRFRDQQVQKWAYRVWEVLSTPGLLAECEERFLIGEPLEQARKARTKLARSLEREQARAARKEAAKSLS